MDKKYKTYFIVLYVVGILVALYSLLARLGVYFGVRGFIEQNPTLGTLFLVAPGFLLIVLSIAAIVLSLRNKLPKYTLLYPVYYLVWYLIWIMLIPFWISIVYNDSGIIALETLAAVSRYDIIFYVVDILIIAYSLYRLYKDSNRNSYNSYRNI